MNQPMSKAEILSAVASRRLSIRQTADLLVPSPADAQIARPYKVTQGVILL
jgi:hypothetical protein